MRLLLDSHILLWRLDDSSGRLPQQLQDALDDRANAVFVSAVTLWEVAIKASAGKIQVPDDLPTIVARAGFEELAIRSSHTWAVKALPPIHQDPFDRLLVAQARIEELTLVTHDRQLPSYGVPVWLV